MTGNRRRKTASRKSLASKPQRTTGQMPDQRSSDACTSAATANALPPDVLLLVFQKLGFPHRFRAAAGELTRVCSGTACSSEASYMGHSSRQMCQQLRYVSRIGAVQFVAGGGTWHATLPSRAM
jgi:hypothetical protein